MTRTRREIECIARLQELNGSIESILDFLLLEKFINAEEAKTIKLSTEAPKVLQAKLSKLSKEERFQLLEYEWVLLPVERIKLFILTDRGNAEFTYNF